MARYKQIDIYTAIQGNTVQKPVEQVSRLVGSTDIQPVADEPTYYVSQLPVNCFKCACNRTWAIQDGKTIKCQITGNSAPASEQGGKERRNDCPLKLINNK